MFELTLPFGLTLPAAPVYVTWLLVELFAVVCLLAAFWALTRVLRWGTRIAQTGRTPGERFRFVGEEPSS